jgi:transcriptional regulator with XRE-family HTH domain
MERDWARFGRAVKAARAAGDMTQEELATAAGVGVSTIQTLERGSRHYARVTANHRAVAQALGWTGDSVERVLAGGEPTVAEAPLQPVSMGDAASAAPVDDLLDGLTERARLALQGGTVVDADVIDLAPDDPDSVAVLILKRGDRPATTPEQMRADLKKWAELQRAARRIFSDED